MTSQDKLIKQGIKYTDAVFDEIAKRLSNGVKASDTLEDFLSKYDLYTTNDEDKKEGKNKPILLSEYKDKMLQIILAETNNHKFSRPSQKELVRVTIENRVGDLIVDVGEDVQASVREIVKDGYNNELSQDEIAEQITQKVSTIKTKRARAIARTEIARTAVASDYIISKERGATHFYVECRNTACPICKKAWHTKWTPETDDTFTPKEYTAGKKGWVGDRTFSMSDVKDLPPKHPNCRCVPYFYKDKRSEPIQTTTEPVQTTTTVTETIEERPTNSMFKGKYKEYSEEDHQGRNLIVREYENGLKLAVEENSKFTHDEIITHIESLPEPLRNIGKLKTITFTNDVSTGRTGRYLHFGGTLTIYDGDLSKEEALDTFNHEIAHAFDHSNGDKDTVYGASRKEIYDDIFKADDRAMEYTNVDTGEVIVIHDFPTSYAQTSYERDSKYWEEDMEYWLEHDKKGKKPEDLRYIEDFAESTRLYLNPRTHDDFVKRFPNRAKYLKELYGEPDFDNNPFGKKIKEEMKAEDNRAKLYKNVSKDNHGHYVYTDKKTGTAIYSNNIDSLREQVLRQGFKWELKNNA